jgi:hypothetical protein
MRTMTTRFLWTCLVVFLVFQATWADAATDDAVWAASYDAATGERFIPVELWTGGPWDGTREIRMTKADLYFGKRAEKSLTGPLEWVRPGSGEKLQVYERNNKGKKQLFTVSSRGDGLGRVFDNRYGRDCIDEVKFPLGLWRQGEKRVFDVPCNDGKLQRKIEVTIEKIYFAYQGRPHSLQYHWVVDGGRGKGSSTNMHYTYSPGMGLVSADEEN